MWITVLHLVLRNAVTRLFSHHPPLRTAWEILFLSLSAQSWTQRRSSIRSRIDSSFNSFTASFSLGLCQTKRDPISTWVILDPRSNLPCILPSQECHLFFYLPQTVVFCRYTPTGTQVSWSHYGTLINIHHGYPPGGRLYPQMCLDFREYQHWQKQIKKSVLNRQGGHRALRWGAERRGWGGTRSGLPVIVLTNQFDRRAYEKVQLH